MQDFFISHASEDKDEIARPLAVALTVAGYSVWFDEFTLQLGDSLPSMIDRGLASSRFGVVVLSESFFRKQWPKRELDGLVTREIADQTKRILPVWHGVDADSVARYSPTLAARLAVSTVQGVAQVAARIIEAYNAPSVARHPRPATETLAANSPEEQARQDRISRGWQPDGTYRYEFSAQGFKEDVHAFAQAARKRLKLQSLGISEIDGWSYISFDYVGSHPPLEAETLALKHHLRVSRCGPRAP